MESNWCSSPLFKSGLAESHLTRPSLNGTRPSPSRSSPNLGQVRVDQFPISAESESTKSHWDSDKSYKGFLFKDYGG